MNQTTSFVFSDSTSSPGKTVGSGINQKMVEKNARLQLESSKSESGGYGGYNNLNLSVAEEAKEADHGVTSPVRGWLCWERFSGESGASEAPPPPPSLRLIWPKYASNSFT